MQMFVLTFEKNSSGSEVSLAKFVRRISAVGRRVSDIGSVPAATVAARSPAVTSEAERLIFFLCENGKVICLLS